MRIFSVLALLLGFSFGNALAEAQWQTDYPAALAQAKKENKWVLLFFTGSDWCPPCMAMEKSVFSKPKFQEFAARHLVLVELDFPQTKSQDPELAKQNEALMKKFGVQAFPTSILLNPDGKPVDGVLSYVPLSDYLEWIEKTIKQ